MSNLIKTSLVALSILAGASVGYAADNNNGGGRSDFGSDGRPENRVTTPDIWERDQMVDPGTTGSVQGCETDSLDEFGNCIVDPDMQ
jgi:hypothetical protein